jgi:hypothetical protein
MFAVSHGNTAENTLQENVSDVSTQISDSDTPKHTGSQIIFTTKPIDTDTQPSVNYIYIRLTEIS